MVSMESVGKSLGEITFLIYGYYFKLAVNNNEREVKQQF
jgi:hypothetical protein